MVARTHTTGDRLSRRRHRQRVALIRLIRTGAVMGALWSGSIALHAAGSSWELKRMSLEELMDLEVRSVSRRPEKLTEVASAIQVLTGNDVARSAATSLSEALRLAPNLRVAQVNSYGTVISTRGFSTLFANKLLVMIDGRTVYTPLFAGVLWDVQNVLLEDLEQIEIVSGPGGSLWGANAVNGVINIMTKSARDTQGLYVAAAGGTALRDWVGVRYGGGNGKDLYYRVSAQRFNRGPTHLANGQRNADDWDLRQLSFRMDWHPSEANTLTVQADAYDGAENTSPVDSTLDGQNILARWTRTFSARSELTVQAYFDRTWRRDIPSTLTDRLRTSDLDLQHRFPIGERHSILWGAGYRRMESEIRNSTLFVGFVPPRRDMNLFSGFVQDEITLAPDRWKLTVGTKLERNDFSGLEVQPSTRLAWTPSAQHTMWGAISRAIRAPSRIDVDYHIPAFDIPVGTLGVDGGPDFDSEKVLAFELGYRVQPASKWSLSLATFYNRYDDLYSVESVGGTPTFQIQNGAEGESWGAEVSGVVELGTGWRLRGGYTWFDKDLRAKPGHTTDPSSLGNDPKHQVLLQSIMDVTANIQFDVTARFVDALPNPILPGYCTFDARLAWRIEQWELSIAGQNLGDDRHAEFGMLEIPRSVYGKVTWRW